MPLLAWIKHGNPQGARVRLIPTVPQRLLPWTWNWAPRLWRASFSSFPPFLRTEYKDGAPPNTPSVRFKGSSVETLSLRNLQYTRNSLRNSWKGSVRDQN
jgi:hypothetical protein